MRSLSLDHPYQSGSRSMTTGGSLLFVISLEPIRLGFTQYYPG